jgi:transcriptional regulator with XRE-family HTH domain
MVQIFYHHRETDSLKAMGEILKEFRLRKGLSQAQLAELVGVSAGHLSRVETNTKEPSLTLLDTILKALDISVEFHTSLEGRSTHDEVDKGGESPLDIPPREEA